MLRISWMDSEYPADPPEPTPEPIREIIIRETVTETEPADKWVKWLTVLNIILWILYFMGAFDD